MSGLAIHTNLSVDGVPEEELERVRSYGPPENGHSRKNRRCFSRLDDLVILNYQAQEWPRYSTQFCSQGGGLATFITVEGGRVRNVGPPQTVTLERYQIDDLVVDGISRSATINCGIEGASASRACTTASGSDKGLSSVHPGERTESPTSGQAPTEGLFFKVKFHRVFASFSASSLSLDEGPRRVTN